MNAIIQFIGEYAKDHPTLFVGAVLGLCGYWLTPVIAYRIRRAQLKAEQDDAAEKTKANTPKKQPIRAYAAFCARWVLGVSGGRTLLRISGRCLRW